MNKYIYVSTEALVALFVCMCLEVYKPRVLAKSRVSIIFLRFRSWCPQFAWTIGMGMMGCVNVANKQFTFVIDLQ